MQLKGLRAAVAHASAKAEAIIAGENAIDQPEQSPSPGSTTATAATSSVRDKAGLAAGASSPVRDKAGLGFVPAIDAGHKGNGKATPGLVPAIEAGRNGKKRQPETSAATAKSTVATTEKANISTWAHARAALLLRTEGVAVALQWVACSKTIQASTPLSSGPLRYFSGLCSKPIAHSASVACGSRQPCGSDISLHRLIDIILWPLFQIECSTR